MQTGYAVCVACCVSVLAAAAIFGPDGGGAPLFVARVSGSQWSTLP